ncbi:MAG TPA: glycosyltransferase family 4 protein [Gemmatimonadales bacterium]
MQRVLVISHTYVEPAYRGKLRALAARGLEVTVAVPQRWLEPSLHRPIETAWERQGGLEVFPIPARAIGDLERARFGRRPLGALLRDKRPDLLQIEEEPTTELTRQVLAAARRLGIPAVLFTAHNVDHRLPLFTRWGRRRLLRRLKGLTAGSEAAAALARREAPDLPVAVVPQLGVPVPHEPVHAHHEGLAIGFVGRLVARKGLDNLLQALALNRGARWHLTVAGDGPERERLEALASELRLAARIRWTGGLPADALARLWQDIDVLVQPSRALPDWHEPNGHVLVEAMAQEVAVIGTESGVIPEVVGDAGIVVPPGDVVTLAGALSELEDPAARRTLALAGRARALRLYSDDAVAERTLEFWRQIVT